MKLVSVFVIVFLGYSMGQFRRVGYYPNWAWTRPDVGQFDVDQIDPHQFTHLNYAFASLNNVTFEIEAYDAEYDIQNGGYRRFNELKSMNPDLKTLIAIGGWTDSQSSTKYSQLVAEPARIAHFVEQATSFIKEHGFDGLDFDWEYPGNPGVPEDKQRFVALLEALKASFAAENLLLTVAVSCSKAAVPVSYDVPSLASTVDFVNFMAYDIHGAWEDRVDHHAPLRRRPIDGVGADVIAESVDFWLSSGMPSDQLVLGLPAYGRSFTLADPSRTEPQSPAVGPAPGAQYTAEPGFVAFYEVCLLVQDGGWTVVTDPTGAMGPYAFKDSTWMAWDDVEMIQEKVRYAVGRNLGGVMLWEVAMDDSNGVCNLGTTPIMNAVIEALQS